jgi:hypothetical protein
MMRFIDAQHADGACALENIFCRQNLASQLFGKHNLIKLAVDWLVLHQFGCHSCFAENWHPINCEPKLIWHSIACEFGDLVPAVLA